MGKKNLVQYLKHILDLQCFTQEHRDIFLYFEHYDLIDFLNRMSETKE